MEIKTTKNGNVKITLTREQLESLHNLLNNIKYSDWVTATNLATAGSVYVLWGEMGEYLEEN